MLALSRRPGERIVFPSLNVAVEILKIKGNSVRVGVDAPPEVRVFRAEVQPLPATAGAPDQPLTHAQRNQLNTAALAFHLAEMQIRAGKIADAESTLQYGLRLLEVLDKSVPRENRPSGHEREARSIEALIVEDDPVEEALLTKFLRLSGFRVVTAHDGYEALECLAKQPRPDFVLLDMRLPRLNGPATISAIRTNPQLSGVRIFAVTGSNQDEAGVATGPGGVDRWFQKPINPGLLAQAMSAAAQHN